MQSNKGIVKALLVTEDGNVASPNDDIDQLGVLANLQALIGLCTDISKSYFSIHIVYLDALVATVDDDCIHIMLDSTNNTKLLLWRIQERLFHRHIFYHPLN